MNSSRLVFRAHAIQRMFERRFDEHDVRAVLSSGEVIEEYPADTPYPSRLWLGWRGVRPIHVVAADNSADDEIIIITVYEPDLAHWESGFRRRKS
jgi:hypothetical protein